MAKINATFTSEDLAAVGRYSVQEADADGHGWVEVDYGLIRQGEEREFEVDLHRQRVVLTEVPA